MTINKQVLIGPRYHMVASHTRVFKKGCRAQILSFLTIPEKGRLVWELV